MMEGISSEAASFAGHQKLGKLIRHLRRQPHHHRRPDRPRLQRGRRRPLRGLRLARAARGRRQRRRTPSTRPSPRPRPRPAGRRSSPCARTSAAARPNKQDKAAAHGAPLGADEVKLTKEACGWPLDAEFFVPDEVREAFLAAAAKAAEAHAEWTKKFEAWRAADAARAAVLGRRLGERPARGLGRRPARLHHRGQGRDPRRLGQGHQRPGAAHPDPHGRLGRPGAVQQHPDRRLATTSRRPRLPGRNVRWGVRELAMAAMANGLSTHGGIRPYVATFFVFVDYMRPAMRLSALMKQPVDLRAHARQHRRRRGRPHAPADRAPRHAARHAGLRRPASGRRQRDGRGLEARHADHRRARSASC